MKISIKELSEDFQKFETYKVEYDDPLTPLRLKAIYDAAAVSLTPAYIALKKGDNEVTIRHIKEINRNRRRHTYTLTCTDHGANLPKELVITCK